MSDRINGLQRSVPSVKNRIFLFMALLGPGIITAAADNDAQGIATYSIVGAKTGYSLLWMLLIAVFGLAVTQEIGMRIGIVTGKGLGGLIREKFGLRLTTFAIVTMLVANLGTAISEFAGVAAAMEIFNISRYISVPIVAAFAFMIIRLGGYERIRKIFLLSVVLYGVYVVSGLLAHPDWPLALKGSLTPSFHLGRDYLVMFIATIGTTITPWGQFFIQSYTIDRGMSIKELGFARADVYLGSVVIYITAFFIVVACAATIWVQGGNINTAKDAALALKPLAGNFAAALFAFGLLNASVLGASILPLSSSYSTCEAFGWEAGIDRKANEAPLFYGLYSSFIILGALPVLIPGAPLVPILFLSAALNGILMPIILIYVMKIANDKHIMGEYRNGPVFNLLAWAMTIFIIIVTSSLLVAMVLGYA